MTKPFFLCFLILLISVFPVVAQQKGTIQDSIPVSGHPGETFALYLPTTYDSEIPSAIVFIFDPGGRGAAGIQPFIPSAEAFQYILVCSNNAKNGPYRINLEFADHLFKHVLGNYLIAEKRIYTAGFSGGSRMAATIAVLSNAMQGVVACGAGFSKNPLHFPQSGQQFSYVGLVGDRDMNYQEMHRTRNQLSELGIANELFLYEDDHRWPPPEELLKAFEWLELEADRKGVKKISPAVLNSSYAGIYTGALKLEENNEIILASEEYKRILRNYKKHFSLDSISRRLTALEKSKAYREERKAQKKVVRLEDTLSTRFVRRFKEEESVSNSPDDFKWWKNQLQKLDEKYIASDISHYQKMGKRLRYLVFAMAIESYEIHIREKERSKAAYCEAHLLVQSPENPFFHYRIAIGNARLGNWEKTLKHLESAASYGWEDKESWKQNPLLKPLWNRPRFKALVP